MMEVIEGKKDIDEVVAMAFAVNINCGPNCENVCPVDL